MNNLPSKKPINIKFFFKFHVKYILWIITVMKIEMEIFGESPCIIRNVLYRMIRYK